MDQSDLGYIVPEKKPSVMESHIPYLQTLLYISLIWGGIMGLLKWIELLIDHANHNEVGWIILTLIFTEILIPFHGILPAFLAYAVLFLISVIPYLIIRGFIKK